MAITPKKLSTIQSNDIIVLQAPSLLDDYFFSTGLKYTDLNHPSDVSERPLHPIKRLFIPVLPGLYRSRSSDGLFSYPFHSSICSLLCLKRPIIVTVILLSVQSNHLNTGNEKSLPPFFKGSMMQLISFVFISSAFGKIQQSYWQNCIQQALTYLFSFFQTAPLINEACLAI